MNDETFPQALRGYSKEAVDARVSELLAELSLVKQKARHATQDLDAIRSENATLKEKLKNNSNFGFADLGTQFEQTLRVAEEQARKLISDASQESLRIRDTAQAEADQVIRKAQTTAARLVSDAEQKVIEIGLQETSVQNSIKAQRAQAEQEVTEVKIQAQQEANAIIAASKEEAAQLKAVAASEVDVLRNETNRIRIEAQDALVLAQAKAADLLAKANAQILAERASAITELEGITAQVSSKRLEHEQLQRQIDQDRSQAELEIAEQRRKIEDEIRAMYANALADNEANMKKADAALEEATSRAAQITSQAENLLKDAQAEAEELFIQARRDTFEIIAEARKRSEALTSRAEGYALRALQDAESRVSKLQSDYQSMTDFADSLKSLMSTDAMVGVIEVAALNPAIDFEETPKKPRKSTKKSAETEVVDAEIVNDSNEG